MGLIFETKRLRCAAAIAAVSALTLGLPTLAAAQETLTLGSAPVSETRKSRYSSSASSLPH